MKSQTPIVLFTSTILLLMAMTQAQGNDSGVTNIPLPGSGTPSNLNVIPNPTSPMPLLPTNTGVTNITLPTPDPLSRLNVSPNPISPMPLVTPQVRLDLSQPTIGRFHAKPGASPEDPKLKQSRSK